MSAHEDGCIRFFDLSSSTNKQSNQKPIHTILAHDDSVTSLSYNSASSNLISISHDGNLKIWDLRNYSCVQEIKVNDIFRSVTIRIYIFQNTMKQFIVLLVMRTCNTSLQVEQFINPVIIS